MKILMGDFPLHWWNLGTNSLGWPNLFTSFLSLRWPVFLFFSFLFSLFLFSYASSSTLYPCKSLSGLMGQSWCPGCSVVRKFNSSWILIVSKWVWMQATAVLQLLSGQRLKHRLTPSTPQGLPCSSWSIMIPFYCRFSFLFAPNPPSLPFPPLPTRSPHSLIALGDSIITYTAHSRPLLKQGLHSAHTSTYKQYKLELWFDWS